ncbi:MAG: hypothetical protein M1820_007126 [Bogoriella megaspora]|nr:MAG: hypothetical protein M1820_007126 [Bogoriella megaspora]
MANTVTIDKSYLDALLRRAGFVSLQQPAYNKLILTSRPVQDAAADQTEALPILGSRQVIIPKDHHDELLRQSKKYKTLKSALLRGGIDEGTLDLLTTADSTQPDSNGFELLPNTAPNPNPNQSYANCFSQRPSVPVTISAPPPIFTPYNSTYSLCHGASSFGSQDLTAEGSDDKGTRGYGQNLLPHQPNEPRTLRFSNLSDRTTHKDLLNIVRGGKIVELYIRDDRTACVSFVDGAKEFFAYAKRNDFYVNQKRLEIRWNDRQFQLSGHIAYKISTGATRNIVIHGGASKLTEEGIREDMEHIHNLVIVDVSFQENDVYVSTNSIYNAVFARTCMMSRAAYKGLKIGWYADECEGPLPQQQPRRQAASEPKPSKSTMPLNRFSLLDVDGESEEGSDDDAAETSFSIAPSWVNTSIAT